MRKPFCISTPFNTICSAALDDVTYMVMYFVYPKKKSPVIAISAMTAASLIASAEATRGCQANTQSHLTTTSTGKRSGEELR